MLSGFHAHSSDGLGGRVFEQLGVDVVLAFVMVKNDLFVLRVADDIGHVTELNPGAGVENDMQIGIGKISGGNVGADVFDFFIGIDKLQIRRNGIAADDADRFAQRLQDPSHPQTAAQGITIGADMAGKDDIVGGVNDGAKSSPVDVHVISFCLVLINSFTNTGC